ncbi:MAG: type IV pili methyl-accepting chemotaxis transducer N-terminal domain-containing protein [Flavobacterium sp.]
MKKRVCLFIAFLLVSMTTSAQTITLRAAINKAGLQRALSQRMAKDYLLIGAGIRIEEAKADMDEVTSVFNENLHDLTLFAKAQDLKDALRMEESIWAKFRQIVTDTPDISQATTIIKNANDLLTISEIVVQKLQVNNKGAKLTNECGRQRMYLQRIAMLYTAKYWEVPYTNLNKDLSDSIEGFESGINTLLATSENTVEIKELLKFQKSEWDFLKKSFDDLNNLKPASVFSSTALMAKDFNKITTLYETVAIN